MAEGYPNGGALDARLASLERGRPSLPAIIASVGVLFTIAAVIGGWITISWSQRITILETNAVRIELFDRLEGEVNRLRDNLVGRGEHEQKWRNQESADANLDAHIRSEVSNLQRQIDAIKTDFGGTYSLRDKIAELTEEVETLRARTYNLNAQPAEDDQP